MSAIDKIDARLGSLKGIRIDRDSLRQILFTDLPKLIAVARAANVFYEASFISPNEFLPAQKKLGDALMTLEAP